jgi:hypothetical protein
VDHKERIAFRDDSAHWLLLTVGFPPEESRKSPAVWRWARKWSFQ